jgi:hypothetical protein
MCRNLQHPRVPAPVNWHNMYGINFTHPRKGGFEFSWASGPPVGMKALSLRACNKTYFHDTAGSGSQSGAMCGIAHRLSAT